MLMLRASYCKFIELFFRWYPILDSDNFFIVLSLSIDIGILANLG